MEIEYEQNKKWKKFLKADILVSDRGLHQAMKIGTLHRQTTTLMLFAAKHSHFKLTSSFNPSIFKNNFSKLDRLPEYLRDTVDWLIGKSPVMYCSVERQDVKKREGADSASSGDSKLYLEATVLERKLPEMDMKLLVDLPPRIRL
ncbi:hypothetical protein NQ317_003362 [Molorchus minor]|uniref:Uncharacterized protein n=1 Tax=Molorchus minor TaxID=1323400 RepID=A0ABQ9K6J4_9CUCU|nr:hypothetical protein NQ317_003362 [Molorchus minor]